MSTRLILSAITATLFAGSAYANHCDDDVTAALNAIDGAVFADDNAVATGETLVELALDACDLEEDLIAAAPADSPLLDPDHVTNGLSILISVVELMDAQ